jgi:fructoselysine 6-phosphate deglycase
MRRKNVADIQRDSLFYTGSVMAPTMQFLLDQYESDLGRLARDLAARGVRRLYAVGGGASLSAMMGLEQFLHRYGDLDVRAMNGWQALAAVEDWRHAAVVATSYSGQTPEVLEVVHRARAAGAYTLAWTDTPETPLAEAAESVMPFRSKAVYVAPLTLAYLLGAAWLDATGRAPAIARQIREDLHALPDRLPELLNKASEDAQRLAGPLASHYYVVAGGPQYGLGYKLALSVIIENLWTNATILQTGEFYHGPIEIVRPEGPTVICLLGEDPSRPASERVVRFLEERGAPHLVFDVRRYGQFSEWMAPFPLFAVTELWVMWMAANMGHDVDERRYMGKVASTWGVF